MSFKIGIAPDSWGVWFQASDPNNRSGGAAATK